MHESVFHINEVHWILAIIVPKKDFDMILSIHPHSICKTFWYYQKLQKETCLCSFVNEDSWKLSHEATIVASWDETEMSLFYVDAFTQSFLSLCLVALFISFHIYFISILTGSCELTRNERRRTQRRHMKQSSQEWSSWYLLAYSERQRPRLPSLKLYQKPKSHEEIWITWCRRSDAREGPYSLYLCSSLRDWWLSLRTSRLASFIS